MGSDQRVVCVKKVKQKVAEEWDESMPLPGDIIEGIAAGAAANTFIPAKARSVLSSQLGSFSRQTEVIWLKVRRGDSVLKLQACVVKKGCSKLQRRFTIRAASDERHVVGLADLTHEQCTALQEMSRKIVTMDSRGFNKEAIKYDWKMKVGTYIPDEGSTVISSILFMPLEKEHNIEATTTRTMAWFSAAVSSGAPLVFVNIQTEQITNSKRSNIPAKESARIRQQKYTTDVQRLQGIRLWFLPGVAEVSFKLAPENGETRFGMNISRIDEVTEKSSLTVDKYQQSSGFVYVHSVTKETAAERAGLGDLLEQANKTGHLVVISRLEGRSLMPSTVSSDGLIHCGDNAEIKDTLTSAIEELDSIRIHIMSWPNNMIHQAPQPLDVSTLRPPQY
ncbi:uncharacterized protein LOC113779403 [Coffea eugenioides]|uniref:uncharacterized protein LOC113779403 n=1 Tax=Coffea eugenioides TaxID=49369 RepID=UPI000F607002|nr:uncharacterized protein LOC113779403 [Coffea eugenioides]